jgi:hypothetical protein
MKKNSVEDHKNKSGMIKTIGYFLAQYLKISYAELVPTGCWHRAVGRVRLDMHRTGNKQCTKNWGATYTV